MGNIKYKFRVPRSKKDHQPKKNEKTADLAMVGSPAFYQNILRHNPHDQKSYDRLMVLYRQQKKYRKELQIINTAIKIFEKLYTPVKSRSKQVTTISNKLNKALGLVDKKGKVLFEKKPVSTWKKRRELVLRKLKAG